jgi:murein DD-endopeptidase MepM/ murein hydrolase activator NlpD
MRAYPRTRLPLLVLGVVAALVALACQLTPVARADPQAADPRLQEAVSRRVAVQQRLDGLLDRTGRLEAEVAAYSEQLEGLRATAAGQGRRARAASGVVASRIRAAYKWGQADVSLSLLTSGSLPQVKARARLLALLAQRSRAQLQTAAAARVRTDAAASQVAMAVQRLRARQAELDAARAEATRLVAEAESIEQQVRATIAAERRAAREAAARRREAAAAAAAAEARAAAAAEASETASARSSTSASRSGNSDGATSDAGSTAGDSDGSDGASGGSNGGGGNDGGSSDSSGGVACPVGQPRSYSDTFGAPRSGGRSHTGTDILAPHGTPSYAYEDGIISRLEGSSLGGISLYLEGASGASYYYTHLSGYAADASVGKTVSAGELIAYVGDTGNAAGISHLHFEVMPGGGASVNPYPYVVRACG